MIKIYVRFRERGRWSTPYTYLPKEGDVFKYGDIVLVPTGDFYSVAKVVKVVEGATQRENIKYKEIIKRLFDAEQEGILANLPNGGAQ